MPPAAIKSFAERLGISSAKVEKYWDEAKTIVSKEYDKGKESEKFYGTAMKILKNKLKKHEGLTESRLSEFLTREVEAINESVEDADFVEDFLNKGRAKEKVFTEKDADPKELAIGIKVEMEHTSNKEIAKRISLDHLAEIKDYYTRLKKMEGDAGITD